MSDKVDKFCNQMLNSFNFPEGSASKPFNSISRHSANWPGRRVSEQIRAGKGHTE